ncbi:MAG TPA: sigma-70 family RNA polymerase sigma factor [Saprospiraceae bacterium]|nr:sigma-70 family RNA polymerase sigma factor [Saprospiraceae bacterium]
MTEPELINLLRNSDPMACRILVDRYGGLVFNTALGLLQHHSDAEDMAQEVFAYAFQRVGEFRGDAKLSTWLYRITLSKSLDFLKAKKRNKRSGFLQSIFGPEGAGLAVDKPHFQHPGVLLERQEQAQILFWAIDKLPEQQKTAFVLHKLEDQSYAEIAEIMQVSLSSVESLMFRARQNLKTHLGKWYAGEGR